MWIQTSKVAGVVLTKPILSDFLILSSLDIKMEFSIFHAWVLWLLVLNTIFVQFTCHHSWSRKVNFVYATSLYYRNMKLSFYIKKGITDDHDGVSETL